MGTQSLKKTWLQLTRWSWITCPNVKVPGSMPGSVAWIPFEALCCRSPSLALSLSCALSPFAVAPSRHLLLCIPAWSSLGPWVQSQLHKALHLVLCVCVFFFFSLFEILGSLVWLGMILLRRRCLWEICVCRLGWIAVAGQCMRRRSRRRRRRSRNLVLCVLLALSSFVEILRGIPLNEFFDEWEVKLQACVCFSYRFGSVAEIRGGVVSQRMMMFQRFAGFTRELAERTCKGSVAMELLLLREEEEEGSSFAATRMWRARLRKFRSGRPSFFSGMYVSVSLQQSARQYLWVFCFHGTNEGFISKWKNWTLRMWWLTEVEHPLRIISTYGGVWELLATNNVACSRAFSPKSCKQNCELQQSTRILLTENYYCKPIKSQFFLQKFPRHSNPPWEGKFVLGLQSDSCYQFS